ncbi:MAG: endolytic transglycosylase MltG, partial [Brucellaceae bacterium]|nr:endolytic transglycosylase MltG [Brucellaceae bacterium]
MSDNNGNASAVPGRPDMPSVLVPKSASEALRPEAGTPPPRRSRRARNQFVVFLNFVFSVVIFLTLAGGAAIYFGAREFEEPGPLQTTDTVLVRPNTSVAEIATQLERLNMVSDARIFRLGVRAFGSDSTLKAGEYEVRSGASMRDIMELMQSGKSVQHALTIPEGMTVWQAFKRIAATEELSGDMPAELPPEGSLAADTLRFTRGMERQAIVDKLMADQRALVQSIWERRDPDLPIKDIGEFVTLASIVEKETGRADERPRVASVFVNRLRRGMRLQSDPTILYGLFGGQGKPDDRPIYRSDIDKPTPYNTYTIDGLPPGPIANPGRAALEAVANPSETKDLYFVADGTGGHVFAETL